MRYSTRFSQKALFCLDEYGPIENAPTLKDACVHLFMAGFIDRCVFTASFIGRCMQAPSKSQKHGAAVNRRRRLQFLCSYMSGTPQETFSSFRAQLRPKTASRSDDMASSSEDDAHLRPKTLQDRFKTVLEPLLTPTWPNLTSSWPPRGPKNVEKPKVFVCFRYFIGFALKTPYLRPS